MRLGLSIISVFLMAFILAGCASKNPRMEPTHVVGSFDINKYSGTWYEIGRIDDFWSKDTKNVTTDFNLLKKDINILKKETDIKSGKEKIKEGKAKFAWNKKAGALKISYSGLFYQDYNIVKLDSNYKYALVYGKDAKHLWFLSRTKKMPEVIKNVYIKYAQDSGYDTSKIIWTIQE